jgi:hypothetical protein
MTGSIELVRHRDQPKGTSVGFSGDLSSGAPAVGNLGELLR